MPVCKLVNSLQVMLYLPKILCVSSTVCIMYCGTKHHYTKTIRCVAAKKPIYISAIGA